MKHWLLTRSVSEVWRSRWSTKWSRLTHNPSIGSLRSKFPMSTLSIPSLDFSKLDKLCTQTLHVLNVNSVVQSKQLNYDDIWDEVMQSYVSRQVELLREELRYQAEAAESLGFHLSGVVAERSGYVGAEELIKVSRPEGKKFSHHNFSCGDMVNILPQGLSTPSTSEEQAIEGVIVEASKYHLMILTRCRFVESFLDQSQSSAGNHKRHRRERPDMTAERADTWREDTLLEDDSIFSGPPRPLFQVTQALLKSITEKAVLQVEAFGLRLPSEQQHGGRMKKTRKEKKQRQKQQDLLEEVELEKIDDPLHKIILWSYVPTLMHLVNSQGGVRFSLPPIPMPDAAGVDKGINSPSPPSPSSGLVDERTLKTLLNNLWGERAEECRQLTESDEIIVNNVCDKLNLNPSQRAALRQSIESKLTLIQGPPGTGKVNDI